MVGHAFSAGRADSYMVGHAFSADRAESYMVGHAFSAELTVMMMFLQPDGPSVIHIPLKARHSARSHATYTGGSQLLQGEETVRI
jgi:hypothetical protein